MIHVLGISGSLRAGSYSRILLRTAGTLMPEGMVLEIAEIRDVPFYDADVEAHGFPAPVVELRERIRRADALLISTPEYNYSIPGVLKNSIDWVSRPPNQPFVGKPAAIMGSSDGIFGSVRAQQHFRNVASTLQLYLMPKPEVMVPRMQDKLNAAGEITDGTTLEAVRALLSAFRTWILHFRPQG